MTDIVECPKCGKKALVARQNDVFQCLICDFRRDFSKPETKANDTFPWSFVILIVTLIVMLWQADTQAPQPRPQSLQMQPSYINPWLGQQWLGQQWLGQQWLGRQPL